MSTNNDPQDSNQAQDHLKSIVYGDVTKNKYGTFRCFCATVSDQRQIDEITSYLRENFSFHRLSKFSYAYRIVNQAAEGQKIEESFHNDLRLDGCGEKMIHLLKKFNVENVLLILGADKKETLSILSSEYYHTIIERAKDLLNTLYERVIEDDVELSAKDPTSSILKEPSKTGGLRARVAPTVQTVNFMNIPQAQSARKPENMNSFLTVDHRQPVTQRVHLPSINEKKKLLHSVLKNNMKRNREKLQNILSGWQENDYQYLRFINLYEKSAIINKVFKILMLMEDIKHAEELQLSYNFKFKLPLLMVREISREKCKKITETLRQDKTLNIKMLEKDNVVVASLLEYLALIVRNHELADRITELDQTMDKKSSPMTKSSKGLLSTEDMQDDLALDLTKSPVDSTNLRSALEQIYDDDRIVTIPTTRDSDLFTNAIIYDKTKDKKSILKQSSKELPPKQSQFSPSELQSHILYTKQRSGSQSEDGMPSLDLRSVERSPLSYQKSQQISESEKSGMMLIGSGVLDLDKNSESASPQKIKDILSRSDYSARIASMESFKPTQSRLPALIMKNQDYSMRSHNRSTRPTLKETKSAERFISDVAQSAQEGLKGQVLRSLRSVPAELTASQVKSAYK